MSKLHLSALVMATCLAAPIQAAQPQPEIVRGPAKPQDVAVAHTVRAIPEACTRLEGMFTGQSSEPYRFSAVRTSPACQARARFVDAAQAKPSAQAGWVLNDVIRVPSARCMSQQAVVRVWRMPGQASPPALDAQGRARIYLQDSQMATRAPAKTPVYSASMALEGNACR